MITIYKKGQKGEIRVINFWTEGDKFCQSSGIKDGKLVENTKVCKPRNINKSNATTGEEQAISDMQSKLREKLQEDYFTFEMLEELAKKQNLI